MPEAANLQDRTSLLAFVSELYYVKGMDQSAIAQKIGVTRSMISRMLTDARNRGIVEIRIHHPLQTEPLLEEQLQNYFGIDSVSVIHIHSHEDHSHLLAELGRAGASTLLKYIEPGKSIGLAWGTTVSAVIDALDIPNAQPGKVIQLIGALGARNHEYDGHALVQRLADKLGSESHFINAPYLCKTAEIARAFMETPGIQETIEMGKHLDIALLGIGTTELQYSSYILAGYVQTYEIERLRTEGAVGDIAGNHLNINGTILHDAFTQRQLTIQSKNLLRTPIRICVAGGPGKTNAIVGALRSGLVTTLVTDSITARYILTKYQS